MINCTGSSLDQLYPSKWPVPLITLGCLPGSVCLSIWTREKKANAGQPDDSQALSPCIKIPNAQKLPAKLPVSVHHFRKASEIKAGFYDFLSSFQWIHHTQMEQFL